MTTPRTVERTFSVGLIAPEFPPDIGGVETYSFELAKALAALGHRVTVFTVPHSAGEIASQDFAVLPVLRQRRRLDRRLLTEHAPDVWHATNAAYSWMALEARNVVVSVHGNDFLRPYVEAARPDLERYAHLWRLRGQPRTWLTALDRWIGRWRTRRLLAHSLPKVSQLVANSRYTESALIEACPQCSGRTSVAWVGVGEAFLRLPRTPRAPGDPVQLLTVCRLSEPRKNVDLVLRALAPLKDRYRFRYTVVGDGTGRESLERLATQLGLSGVVRFTGRLTETDLMLAFAAADLFVLTSSVLPGSHEGFGIVYLEANAAGVPVLAARLAGAVEAVEEGVSGMFVDEPTVAQIGDTIERFLAGKVEFSPERCRKFASAFTWTRVASHFTDRYGRIAVPPIRPQPANRCPPRESADADSSPR